MATFKAISKKNRQRSIDSFSVYLHGRCFLFAIAVSRGTGAQLVLVEAKGQPVHAGVRSELLFRDLRGDLDEARFIAPYVHPDSCVVRDTTERELLELSEALGAPILEQDIAYAARHAESIWPEWDWKEGKLKKVLAFTEELEVLCVKYGVCIREHVPATPIYIYQREGDEGFEIEHFSNPTNQFLLKRVFR